MLECVVCELDCVVLEEFSAVVVEESVEEVADG